METLNYVGLGGMAEIGCKMSVLEVGGDLYIFDSGMKYPEDVMFGIDKVIPDMTYITKNRKRVKAIFISNISDEVTGSLDLLLDIVQVPVYASAFTISVLKTEIHNVNQTYIVLKADEQIKIGAISVTAFSLTYSLPGNIGFLVQTKLGNVVYMSDYVFNQNVPVHYATDLAFLGKLVQQPIVALISPVKGAETLGFGANESKFAKQIHTIIKQSEQAVFINTFTKNFLAIQYAISAAEAEQKKICILGYRAYQLITAAIKTKVLSIKQDTLVSTKKMKEMDRSDIVFLVLGDEGVPYNLMLHILSDTHRDVIVDPADTVVIAVPKIPGSELKVSAVIDALFTKQIEATIIDPQVVMTDTAGIEDMKLLYNFIKPQYLITFDAEYRQMVEFKASFVEYGLNEHQIIFADNGEWISFSDGQKCKSPNRHLPLDEVLLNGNIIEDSDNFVLKEREQLSADGVVLLTVVLSEEQSKYEVSYINFKSQGFIPMKEQKYLISNINTDIAKVVEKCNNGNKEIRIAELKKKIKDDINQTIYREIKRHPVVVVQFVIRQK